MAGPAESALIHGLGHLQRAQEAIAHNLANATSNGYKRRTVVAEAASDFGTALDRALPDLRTRTTLDVDPSSGVLEPTGDRHHLAIDGDAWFAVRSAGGADLLTRRGEFVVDAAGTLRTTGGDAVLDAGGRTISLAGAREWTVAPDGTVRGRIAGEDAVLGRVGTFRVADAAALEPRGNGRFAAPPGAAVLPATPADAAVRQGYVERSNVDAMLELVRMIGVQRGHEAQSRALGTLHRMHAAFATAFDR